MVPKWIIYPIFFSPLQWTAQGKLIFAQSGNHMHVIAALLEFSLNRHGQSGFLNVLNLARQRWIWIRSTKSAPFHRLMTAKRPRLSELEFISAIGRPTANYPPSALPSHSLQTETVEAVQLQTLSLNRRGIDADSWVARPLPKRWHSPPRSTIRLSAFRAMKRALSERKNEKKKEGEREERSTDLIDLLSFVRAQLQMDRSGGRIFFSFASLLKRKCQSRGQPTSKSYQVLTY